MNFALQNFTTVKLDHVNVRTEKHGDTPATAVDVRFVLTGMNSQLLAMFHPDLCDRLYYNHDAENGQQEVDGIDHALPNLRFANLGPPLTWDDEITSARVEIDYGLGDDSNIILAPVKVNQFKIECMEGGTVEITFRAQCSAIPDGALDKLGRLLNTETQVMVIPPEPATGHVIDGTLLAFERDHPGANVTPIGAAKKGADATDMFLEQHGDGEDATGTDR